MGAADAGASRTVQFEGPVVRDYDSYSLDIRDRARVLSKRLRPHGIEATDHQAYMVMCAHLEAAYQRGCFIIAGREPFERHSPLTQ